MIEQPKYVRYDAPSWFTDRDKQIFNSMLSPTQRWLLDLLDLHQKVVRDELCR